MPEFIRIVLKEIGAANTGHVTGYGADVYTEKALSLFREQLGSSTETFFVFTGTAANVLGLSGIVRSWNSVITASTAHLEGDECGAPEKFIGCKVLVVDTPDGKVTPELIEKHMHGIDFEHHSQPKVISITQCTEMGTVYSVAEITAISEYAHARGMLLAYGWCTGWPMLPCRLICHLKPLQLMQELISFHLEAQRTD